MKNFTEMCSEKSTSSVYKFEKKLIENDQKDLN